MNFSKLDFSKVKTIDTPKTPIDPEAMISAIVKVKESGYHPDVLTVRSQMDEYIFTAEFKAKNLEALENDPLVESVSPAEPFFLSQNSQK